MLKTIAAIWCRSLGWKTTGHVPKRLSKSIVVAGPNTGFKSFWIGMGVSDAIHYKSRFMVDRKWFFFPLGWFLRRSGARKFNPHNPTEVSRTLVNRFNERRKYSVVVCPKKSSFKSTEWHRLFYDLSRKTRVPIVLVALDYSKKTVKFHSHFKPGTDPERDLEFIRKWFINNDIGMLSEPVPKLERVIT